MTRLAQIVAVESGQRNTLYSEITSLKRVMEKPGLTTGQRKSYSPLDENGEQLPDDDVQVQVKASDVLARLRQVYVRLFDIVATREYGNAQARADVVIGQGDNAVTLLRDVPVTYLLFLEKQVTDLQTVINALPTLDPAESWQWDDNAGLYRTGEVRTARSQKIMRNHVLAAATKEHPAQVHPYTEDVPVGYYRTVRLSGALKASEVQEFADRVRQLLVAVRFARENANNVEVENQTPGKVVLDWLFR